MNELDLVLGTVTGKAFMLGFVTGSIFIGLAVGLAFLISLAI